MKFSASFFIKKSVQNCCTYFKQTTLLIKGTINIVSSDPLIKNCISDSQGNLRIPFNTL